MALFKTLWGERKNLPETKTKGYAYFCTDDGSFWIDYEDENGEIQRKRTNAAELDQKSTATNLVNSEARDSLVQIFTDEENKLLDPEVYKDNENYGISSVEFGHSNVNYGNKALVAGTLNTNGYEDIGENADNNIIGGVHAIVKAPNSLVVGSKNTIEHIINGEGEDDWIGARSITGGWGNINSGRDSIQAGWDNENNDGRNTLQIGSFNGNSGWNTLQNGHNNSNSGGESVQAGYENTNSGGSTLQAGRGNNNTNGAGIQAGYENKNSGSSSLQVGHNNSNTQTSVIQGGYNNNNTGMAGIQVGYKNTNKGKNSIQSGDGNQNTGESSLQAGTNNNNSGAFSMQVGQYLTNTGSNKTVVGRYNSDKGADTLFEVGNGTGTDQRSNAFEVSADGRAKVYGNLAIEQNVTVEGGLILPNSPTTPDTAVIEDEYTIRQTANIDENSIIQVVDNSMAKVNRVVGNTVNCKNLFDQASATKYSGNAVLKRDDESIIASQNNTDIWTSVNIALPTNLIGKTITVSAKAKTSGQNTACVRVLWMYGSSAAITTGMDNFVSSAVSSNTYTKLSCTGTIQPHTDSRELTLCLLLYSNANGSLSTNTEYTATYSDIQIEIGDTATEYQPYFTGLKSAIFGGIESTGKNLIPHLSPSMSNTLGGITYLVNSDGSITLNGTATQDIIFTQTNFGTNTFKLHSGTYTLSGAINSNIWLQGKISEDDTFNFIDTGKGITFTLSAPCTFRWNLRIKNGTVLDNVTVYPMLERGSIVTEYAPYVELTTFDFPKTETPLGTTIDFENKKIIDYGVDIILTGEEDWTIGDGYTVGKIYFSALYVSMLGYKEQRAKGVATDGIVVSGENIFVQHGVWWLGVGTRFIYMIGAERYFNFTQFADPNNPTETERVNLLSEWKAYLAQRYEEGNPVTIRYVSSVLQREMDFTDEQKAASNEYTVYNGGMEIVQDNDNAEYGAILSLTQTYNIHENPMEAATKAYVNNGLAQKLDKTGGTITGNLVVKGKTDAALSSIVVKNGEDSFGLVYDSEDKTFKLGLGSIDTDNNFLFDEGEGLPVALRDDSSTFTDGHIVTWSANGNKFIDSGTKIEDLSGGTVINLVNGEGVASLQQQILEDGTIKGSVAHGKYSVALNQNNNAYQRNSMAIGGATQAGLSEEEFLAKYPEGVDESGYNYEKANSYAFSSGQETKVRGRGAFTGGGYKNEVDGDYSGSMGGGGNKVKGEYNGTLGGYGNIVTEEASKSSVIDGYTNKISGENSGAGGSYNEVGSSQSHTFGTGLVLDKAHGHNRTAVGKYNDKNSYAIFQVGAGPSDTNRKNVFEVFENGTAKFFGELIDANGEPLISKLYSRSFNFNTVDITVKFNIFMKTEMDFNGDFSGFLNYFNVEDGEEYIILATGAITYQANGYVTYNITRISIDNFNNEPALTVYYYDPADGSQMWESFTEDDIWYFNDPYLPYEVR